MAYVIDGQSIRITDRYANSYYISLNKISLLAFQNDSLDIYVEGHKLRLNETDYLGVEEVRRIYYSLLTSLSAGRAPANIGPSTTTTTNAPTYGAIPGGHITRSLALARGSSKEKEAAKKEEKAEKGDNILRMSKPKK